MPICDYCYGVRYIEGSAKCPRCFGSGRVLFETRSEPPLFQGGNGPPGKDRSGVGGVVVLVVGGMLAWAVLTSDNTVKTDGQKPKGVTPGQFQNDPTFGKLEIERMGTLYKYYDTPFMKKYSVGGKLAKGYTLSRTPPEADVEFIEELMTVFKRSVWEDGRTVSEGRKIPRDQVRPVPYTLGNYIETGSGTVSAERYFYSPPATASDWEIQRAQALLNTK